MACRLPVGSPISPRCSQSTPLQRPKSIAECLEHIVAAEESLAAARASLAAAAEGTADSAVLAVTPNGRSPACAGSPWRERAPSLKRKKSAAVLIAGRGGGGFGGRRRPLAGVPQMLPQSERQFAPGNRSIPSQATAKAAGDDSMKKTSSLRFDGERQKILDRAIVDALDIDQGRGHGFRRCMSSGSTSSIGKKFGGFNRGYTVGSRLSGKAAVRKTLIRPPRLHFVRCGGRWMRLRWPILHPDHTFLLFWNFASLGFLIVFLFSLPFELSFGVSTLGVFWWFAACLDIFFMADVVVSFCTGYFDDDTGEQVMNPRLIARRYMCTWFVPDILSAVPFELISGADPPDQDDYYQPPAQWRALRFTRIAKISRLFKLMHASELKEKVDMIVDGKPMLVFAFGLLQVILLLCAITHWTACAWYVVGTTSDYPTTWVTTFVPEDANASEKYLYAVFFALTTMTTVGYGDISAKNYDEVRFVLVLLLVTSVVFASLMGSLTELIANLNAERHAIAMKRRALSQYLSWRGVPGRLWHDVRSHFLYLWERNKEFAQYEDEIKDQLPPTLRLELSAHIYGEALRRTPFLAWIARYDACIMSLASRVHTRFFGTGDFVFKLGTPNVEAFVLIDGSVRISMNEAVYSMMQEGSPEAYAVKFVNLLTSHAFLPNGDCPPREHNGRVTKPLVSPRSRISPMNHLKKLFARREEESIEDIRPDVFHSPAMLAAHQALMRQDHREAWAAHFIQQRWKRKRKAIGGNPEAQLSASQLLHKLQTKVMQAPAYFGESCFWQPMDEWTTGETPIFSYSVRCETRVELLSIERARVAEVIHEYSPWLGERFDFFQECVRKSVHTDPTWFVSHNSCSVIDSDASGLLGESNVGRHTVRVFDGDRNRRTIDWNAHDVEAGDDEAMQSYHRASVERSEKHVPSLRASSQAGDTPPSSHNDKTKRSGLSRSSQSPRGKSSVSAQKGDTPSCGRPSSTPNTNLPLNLQTPLLGGGRRRE